MIELKCDINSVDIAVSGTDEQLEIEFLTGVFGLCSTMLKNGGYEFDTDNVVKLLQGFIDFFKEDETTIDNFYEFDMSHYANPISEENDDE